MVEAFADAARLVIGHDLAHARTACRVNLPLTNKSVSTCRRCAVVAAPVMAAEACNMFSCKPSCSVKLPLREFTAQLNI